MTNHLVFVCILVLLYCGSRITAFPDYIQENGLDINGSHVCQRPITKTQNTTITRHRKYKETYNSICLFKYCIFKVCSTLKYVCIKTRTRSENYNYTTTQKQYGYSLECCHRWEKISQTDKECLKPICVHGCGHGKCVAGDTCDCDRGWRGYTCTKDINECYNKNGGCQQECHNTPGSHMCGCRRGYTPDANDTTKCTDINECKAPKPRCICAGGNDSQCNTACVNTIGDFRCVCPKGYQLNGINTCTDVDECLSSITNNCPHECVNTPGSFRCTCFKGFKYEKKSNKCKDLNECADKNGGCEHMCLNTYGSYRCRCKFRYRLTPDRKKCLTRKPTFTQGGR